MENIQLTITGMSCGACVHHVTQALQGVEGVEEATVDLEAGSATVRGESLDVAELIEAVEEEGYGAQSK